MPPVIDRAIGKLMPCVQIDLVAASFRLDRQPHLRILQLVAIAVGAALLIVAGAPPDARGDGLITTPVIDERIEAVGFPGVSMRCAERRSIQDLLSFPGARCVYRHRTSSHCRSNVEDASRERSIRRLQPPNPLFSPASPFELDADSEAPRWDRRAARRSPATGHLAPNRKERGGSAELSPCDPETRLLSPLRRDQRLGSIRTRRR